MSRTERRKLKKQQKQAPERRKKRKRALLRWGIIGLGGILFLVIGYVVFFHTPNPSNSGILRIATSEYNLGVASVQKGVLSGEIPIINIGDRALTITALKSSCGCTTASIIKNGVEGPIFRMTSQGEYPKDWSTVIKPGEQALLKVYYDPAVHPGLRGSVTRIVTIYSDDPLAPEQQVRIKVNQVS